MDLSGDGEGLGSSRCLDQPDSVGCVVAGLDPWWECLVVRDDEEFIGFSRAFAVVPQNLIVSLSHIHLAFHLLPPALCHSQTASVA